MDDVDVYVDGITDIDWREKMFNIVKYVPSRHLIVSRKDNKPNDYGDLDHKTCAMVKNTAMEQTLEEIKKTKLINFSYVNTNNFDDMDAMVSDGRADFTVYDSDRAFSALAQYENLTIAWPVSEVAMSGWAIHKQDKLLKSILEKYMKHAQRTSILDKYWQLSYGVSFVDYLRVLKLGAS